MDTTCAGVFGAGVPRWDSGCCYGVRDDGSRDCEGDAAFYRERPARLAATWCAWALEASERGDVDGAVWAWGEAWAQAQAFGWHREARSFAAQRAAVWGLCASKAP